MGKTGNAYKIVAGKHKWKIPLARPGRRWDNNIKLDLKEIRWEGVV